MTNLTKYLKQHAYYGKSETLKKVDITQVIEPSQLELIGQGMNARAYQVPNTNWVVKEGRWDLDMTFFSNLKVDFPADITQDFLDKFNFSFLPKKAEIIRQYRQYLDFCRYYGWFDSSSTYYHPDKHNIFQRQQKVRQDLKRSRNKVAKKYLIRHKERLDLILDDTLQHNFAPDEYLLYGKSISPVNQGKPTYFIFQQYIKGNTFHDVKKKSMSLPLLKQSALFAYLCLYMSLKDKMIPDLRPRHVISQAHDWFGKTDNLIISDTGMYMIDTRWMWNLGDNIVKRGGIIPEQILLSTRNYLNKSLKLIYDLS